MTTIFGNPTEKDKTILFGVAKLLNIPARFTFNNPEIPGFPLIEFEFDSLEDHYAFLELCGWDTDRCQFISNKIPWNQIEKF